MGYPPPPRKCEQTENITFPHPSDAGGNYPYNKEVLLCERKSQTACAALWFCISTLARKRFHYSGWENPYPGQEFLSGDVQGYPLKKESETGGSGNPFPSMNGQTPVKKIPYCILENAGGKYEFRKRNAQTVFISYLKITMFAIIFNLSFRTLLIRAWSI